MIPRTVIFFLPFNWHIIDFNVGYFAFLQLSLFITKNHKFCFFVIHGQFIYC